MKELTPQQIDLYIRRNGVHCPVCESDDIEAMEPDTGGPNRFYRDNKCHSCGAVFTETFTLSHVELSITPNID